MWCALVKMDLKYITEIKLNTSMHFTALQNIGSRQLRAKPLLYKRNNVNIHTI